MIGLNQVNNKMRDTTDSLRWFAELIHWVTLTDKNAGSCVLYESSLCACVWVVTVISIQLVRGRHTCTRLLLCRRSAPSRSAGQRLSCSESGRVGSGRCSHTPSKLPRAGFLAVCVCVGEKKATAENWWRDGGSLLVSLAGFLFCRNKMFGFYFVCFTRGLIVKSLKFLFFLFQWRPIFKTEVFIRRAALEEVGQSKSFGVGLPLSNIDRISVWYQKKRYRRIYQT